MKLPRRKFLHMTGGAAVLSAVSRFAWAQAYPSRPVLAQNLHRAERLVIFTIRPYRHGHELPAAVPDCFAEFKSGT